VNDDHDKMYSIYQDSSHHSSSSNENIDEDYGQEITKSDKITAQSSILTHKEIKMISKQSFIYELGKQLELKLVKDPVFILFAISNFLTRLGFNIPYNFSNDLAIDANIIEYRRHGIIMSIGVGNCFGRVIIGILGDRKRVKTFCFCQSIISVIYLCI
jgi:hypothetical protein